MTSTTPDLFSYVPPQRQPQNYRRNDPATSREAGEHARQFIGAQHQAILTVMGQTGRPMAPEEIADALGWESHVIANRRTVELERARRIAVVPDDFHTNRSGRKARRYRLTGEGGR